MSGFFSREFWQQVAAGLVLTVLLYLANTFGIQDFLKNAPLTSGAKLFAAALIFSLPATVTLLLTDKAIRDFLRWRKNKREDNLKEEAFAFAQEKQLIQIGSHARKIGYPAWRNPPETGCPSCGALMPMPTGESSRGFISDRINQRNFSQPDKTLFFSTRADELRGDPAAARRTPFLCPKANCGHRWNEYFRQRPEGDLVPWERVTDEAMEASEAKLTLS